MLYSWERSKTNLPKSCFPAAARIRFFETEGFLLFQCSITPNYVPAAANYQFMFRKKTEPTSIHIRELFFRCLCNVMTPIYKKNHFSSHIHIICFVKSEWSLLLEEDQTEIPHRLLLSLVGFSLRTSQSWEFLHRFLQFNIKGWSQQTKLF